MYSSLKTTFLFDTLGGKASFASTENDKFITLLPSIPPSILAGGIALLFIFIAGKLPEKTRIKKPYRKGGLKPPALSPFHNLILPTYADFITLKTFFSGLKKVFHKT